MTHQRCFRLAALAACTAMIGWGAQAQGTDATLSPLAWTVSRGEATEFQDAMSRDTMASRAEVRNELMLSQREASVRSEHGRPTALGAQTEDRLGEMIVAMSRSDRWDDDERYALAPDHMVLSLPDNADPSLGAQG